MVLHLSTFIPSLSRFFIPSQSFLVFGLVLGVDLLTLTGRKVIPIRKNLVHKIISRFVPFCPVRKIADLALNAITVPAQYPTDVTRLVVMV